MSGQRSRLVWRQFNKGHLLKISILGGILLCAATFGRAQLQPNELAEREAWESFLETAEITGWVQLTEQEGVTSPWKLTLKKGNTVRYGLWKNVEGRKYGFLEGWNWEIAAYRLDKYLGLNMVPPTVERRFRGNRGSLQLWVEAEMSYGQMVERKLKVPPAKITDWNRAVSLQRLFDNLIANEDRHNNNVLVTANWQLILIDHSRSFRTSSKFTKSLIYSGESKGGPKEMSELPVAVVERVKTLDFDATKSAVGEYLTENEIRAVLVRRDLILEEVDHLVRTSAEPDNL